MDIPLHHLIILGVIAFLLATTIVNSIAMPTARLRRGGEVAGEPSPAGRDDASDDLPLVSVLVPARNEERSIGDCLRSLQCQDYPRLEIILLDDGSTDRTRGIAADLGFAPLGEGKRDTVMAGRELPGGWAGKPWACQQLAEASRGGILLFTDADTVHAPGAVSAAVEEMRASGAGMLSAWPRQVTVTWAEHLVVPLLYLLGASLLPVVVYRLFRRWPALVRRLPSWARMLFGGANGQFIAFDRGTYFAIGGHAAVRAHLVEDVALSRLVMDAWGRGERGLHNCDGGEIVRCRMYRSAAEVWAGFSKNARPVFERHPGGFILAGSLVGFALLGPFVLVFLEDGRLFRICLLEIGLIYVMRFVLALRFRSSWWGALGHPFGFGLGVAIAANSWIQTARGTVVWKGRQYAPFSDTPAKESASGTPDGHGPSPVRSPKDGSGEEA